MMGILKFNFMKADQYTRVLLTVIAICLSLDLGIKLGFVPTARANATTGTNGNALLPSESNTLDVRIVDIATYDELNVNLKGIDTYEELKVNLKSIDTQDELDVNIDELGGQWVSGGGPLPVKIE
jgi:hypothetical protein